MTALLTPNRHHLVHGAAWRMDTAGAPKPYVPIPSRPLKKGEAARCQCGATSGCGVDLQIAQQRASEKCFNCRLRKFAAFDPRGPDDPAAIKDAIKRVFKEEMKNRFKVGGCRCDLPIGRMFDPETKRPYGWFQGHIGMSRDDSEDLQGGKYRAEVRAGKVHKEAWWERSEPGARYTENGGIANARSRERLGDREHDSDRIADSDMSKLGGEKYFPCRSFVYAPTSLPPSSHDGDGTEPPEADLELEFIYGYSAGWLAGAPSSEAGIKMGSDVQDNLYWTAAGELVYPAAATGVVYDPLRHRQRFFTGHDDAITCLAVSPDRRTVATGQCGRYPRVFLWSAVDGADDNRAALCLEALPPARLFERRVASVTFLAEARLVTLGGDDRSAAMPPPCPPPPRIARYRAVARGPGFARVCRRRPLGGMRLK